MNRECRNCKSCNLSDGQSEYGHCGFRKNHHGNHPAVQLGGSCRHFTPYNAKEATPALDQVFNETVIERIEDLEQAANLAATITRCNGENVEGLHRYVETLADRMRELEAKEPSEGEGLVRVSWGSLWGSCTHFKSGACHYRTATKFCATGDCPLLHREPANG